MNKYVTGAFIKELREKRGLTQSELAQRLCVSDKTVSKWETGKGYPDISLLQPLAETFCISVAQLLSGNDVKNTNISSNALKTKFYVCPVCGNVITAMGEASIYCHGIELVALEAEPADERHKISVERVEDEYFVNIDCEMTKSHYISFIAAVSSDRVQIVKTYPEGSASARFKSSDVRRVYFYCNRDGLFFEKIR